MGVAYFQWHVITFRQKTKKTNGPHFPFTKLFEPVWTLFEIKWASFNAFETRLSLSSKTGSRYIHSSVHRRGTQRRILFLMARDNFLQCCSPPHLKPWCKIYPLIRTEYPDWSVQRHMRRRRRHGMPEELRSGREMRERAEIKKSDGHSGDYCGNEEDRVRPRAHVPVDGRGSI